MNRIAATTPVTPPMPKRPPICFALDTSRSMAGAGIDALNEGLAEFWRIACGVAPEAASRVCIVTFGSGVETAVPFNSPHHAPPPRLTADGATPMGEAILRCLNLLSQEAGDEAAATPAVLVLLADGHATDDTSEALAQCLALRADGRLVVYPLALGAGPDVVALSAFAGGDHAAEMESTNVFNFFSNLGQNLAVGTPQPAMAFDRPVMGWNEAMRAAAPR